MSEETAKMKIILLSGLQSLTTDLSRALGEARLLSPEDFCASPAAHDGETNYIYIPTLADHDGMMADQNEAQRVFRHAAQAGGRQFILLSSALIYGTGPGRRALVNENYSAPGPDGHRICDQWRWLESLASNQLNNKIPLTILRPCLIAGSPSFPARLFSRRIVATLPGHDPVLQFLSVSDLAQALLRVIERRASGIFNVAPEGVVPLHSAVRIAGGMRVPLPRTLRRPLHHSETLDYLRFSWTISGEKIRQELGFAPQQSSVAALMQWRTKNTL